MSRRRVVALGSGVLAILLCLVGVTWRSGSDASSVSLNVPEGFEVEFPISEDNGRLTIRRTATFTTDAEDVTLVASVMTYPNRVTRYLLSFGEIPQSRSLRNYDLGIDSPELEGVGFGTDTIQCGSGHEPSCAAWSYWSASDNQLLLATLYGETPEVVVSTDDFRSIVRSVFGPATP
jgi:hypothetical protein